MALADRRARIDAATQIWRERVDWYRRHWPLIVGGAASSGWLITSHPYVVTGGFSAATLIYTISQPEPEPEEIIRLRAVLIDDSVMGPDRKGRPPKVTPEGQHPDGGPRWLTIDPTPSFRDWDENKQEKVERAIESRMGGDWENVGWLPTGQSRWEHLIPLPAKVPYTCHDDKPWHKLDFGSDGEDRRGGWDFKTYPHGVITGNTRRGKTTLLRRASAHLLKGWKISDGVEVHVAAIDVKGGLSYLRDRLGVWLCATRDIAAMTDAMGKVLTEVYARTDQYERTGTYREPLVVMVDELAAACDAATESAANEVVEKGQTPRFKVKGARYPKFTMDLLNVARLGGQVGVHLILATQRPAAAAIPIEIRSLCEWRVAVGSMEPEVAQMLFEQNWQRAVNTPNQRGAITVGEMSGENLAWFQGDWMADPIDTDHDAGERDLADDLLPPKVRLSDTSETSHGTLPESGPPSETSSSSKRGHSSHGTAHVNPADPVNEDVIEETPYERIKRLGRERKARQRARDREDARNPEWPYHGTRRGWVAKCPCTRCRAWSKHRVLEVV